MRENQELVIEKPEYIIVSHPSPDVVQRIVGERMADGYVPFGAPTSHIALAQMQGSQLSIQPTVTPISVLCQAMVLEDEVDDGGERN